MRIQNRPLIGIGMRIEVETNRFYLARHYSEAVEASGGTPLHISLIPNRGYIQSAISNLDGIVLPGSDSDIDPIRFGEEPHGKLGRVLQLKDETDLLILEEIERGKLPLLAICFGMQALNVSRGGSLIQDIESQLPSGIKHEQGAPRDSQSHSIRLDLSSLLGRLAGCEESRVNSHHHQAIDRLGDGLKPVAWASDGIVEGIEDTAADRFVLGVQWHPELDWLTNPLSRALFDELVNRSITRSAVRDSSISLKQDIGAT